MNFQYSYVFKWKKVKGNQSSKRKICPRCKNDVEYFFAWDSEEFGFLGLLTFKHSKKYSFKCPICPEYELLSDEAAKAIIKSK